MKTCSIFLLIAFLPLVLLFNNCSDSNDPIILIPESGYEWPDNSRAYWPTVNWQTAELVDHNIDPAKMQIADDFAANDALARALLVVKDGYLVHENYYGNGHINASTNLWSVTKSFASATVGLIIDDNLVSSVDQPMAELMPQYPEFGEITLKHCLNHTTGLSWAEEGPLWVQWIFSDDWVVEALERGQIHQAGTRWKYSSGNSQFLTALVHHKAGISPGNLAKSRLFDPMGIPFLPLEDPITYNSWEEYIPPLPQSWRQDPMGAECGGFGLYLTARDMAKFGFLYLNRGRWENQQLLSEDWVIESTAEHWMNIYGRYSYGYQWYITLVDGEPAFLGSGYGGQIIGVVPSLDLVVVLKYEAENPEHPVSGTDHDDMQLFELVVRAVERNNQR